MIDYALHILIYLCLYATVGMSLNISFGYGGFLSLAQAAFFAVGAYTFALGASVWGLDLIVILMIASGIAALLSLALSLASWRMRGDFFVMATLAVQTLVGSFLNNWSEVGKPIGSVQNFTNGPSGIAGIPKADILGITLDTIDSTFVIALLLFVVAYLLLRTGLLSPWGKALVALRDDELAARSVGKNSRWLAVQSFALSGIFSATAGVIYASYVGYVDPSLASLDYSILFVCMVVIGGAGSVNGPIIGAVVLIAIPELLRYAQIPEQSASSIRLMAYGLLLVILMHVRPQGLIGRFKIN